MESPYACPVCGHSCMDSLGGDRWRCPACQQDHTPPSLDPELIAALHARMAEAEKSWGGHRPGAGRIAKRGPTEPMRIPIAYKSAILALIEHLDATAQINHHYSATESEPLLMRSLHEKLQFLTFKTTPWTPRRTE